MEALRRSTWLARYHFWLVFLTATLSLILEEPVIHVGAAAGQSITASDGWGVGRGYARLLVRHAVGRPGDLGGVSASRHA